MYPPSQYPRSPKTAVPGAYIRLVDSVRRKNKLKNRRYDITKMINPLISNCVLVGCSFSKPPFQF
jgi:hypothetical protein